MATNKERGTYAERMKSMCYPQSNRVLDVTESNINKLDCKVCGNKIVPSRTKHVIVRNTEANGGVVAALAGSKDRLYDAYICPFCGHKQIAIETYEVVEKDSYMSVI